MVQIQLRHRDVSGQFVAQGKWIPFGRKFEPLTANGTTAGSIWSESSFWRNSYVFRVQDGSIYHFACEKFWTQVYLCMGDGGPYRFYTRKSAIFKGDQQVATVVKRTRFWKGAIYEINMSDDADVLVIACMVIIVHIVAQAADNVVLD